MRIIPAIDIINGQCVRLTKGDYSQKTVYSANPVDVAKSFEDAGIEFLHLVDLDGARSGSIVNLRVLEKVCNQTQLKVDFGGGVKSDESVQDAFNAGANQITAGSIAVKNPELVKRWLSDYGPDRIILGADVKDDRIAINGWIENSGIKLLDFIGEFREAGLKYVISTDVSVDGTLKGPSVDLYQTVSAAFPDLKLIASGGISCLSDLVELNENQIDGVIIGKAIYEKRIRLNELRDYVNKANNSLS